MWVPVEVWQPCELLYTCYLLTCLFTYSVLYNIISYWCCESIFCCTTNSWVITLLSPEVFVPVFNTNVWHWLSLLLWHCGGSVAERGEARRRLALSTVYRETRVNPLHCQIPIGFVKRAVASYFSVSGLCLLACWVIRWGMCSLLSVIMIAFCSADIVYMLQYKWRC